MASKDAGMPRVHRKRITSLLDMKFRRPFGGPLWGAWTILPCWFCLNAQKEQEWALAAARPFVNLEFYIMNIFLMCNSLSLTLESKKRIKNCSSMNDLISLWETPRWEQEAECHTTTQRTLWQFAFLNPHLQLFLLYLLWFAVPGSFQGH